MNSDNASSGSSSVATSEAKQPPPPETPAGKLSEADFLAQQAHDAQLAASKAIREFAARFGQGVNPGAWAKEFPWITVGAAAVAGFIATTAIVPSKEEQALKRLAAIERALTPPAPRSRHHEEEDHEAAPGKTKGGFLGTILHELFGSLRPVLMSILSAHMGGMPGQPQDGAQAGGADQSQGAPDQSAG